MSGSRRFLRRDENPAMTEELLLRIPEIGELKCTMAGAQKLRFESPGHDSCDLELGRALTKMRMMCGRLAVLCNETDEKQDVSIYGGEGTIRYAYVVGEEHSPTAAKCAVRFKNTMHEQEFTLTPE